MLIDILTLFKGDWLGAKLAWCCADKLLKKKFTSDVMVIHIIGIEHDVVIFEITSI